MSKAATAPSGGSHAAPSCNPFPPARSRRARSDRGTIRRRGGQREIWRAAEAFIWGGRELAEIARELSVPETTLRRWAGHGRWEELREEARGSYAHTFRLFLRSLEHANDHTNPASIHAFVKVAEMVGATRELSADDLRLAAALGAWELILATLKARDPEALRALGPHTEAIISALEDAYAPEG